ncbi:MAG: acetyl-CoA C-acyltransferase family protein [Acetobacteraceae bacterium]|nr:acetyl-CoA C-acyltransferase family protein [Acetobacteraceae bacterium]
MSTTVNEVTIVAGVRTAIGGFLGALKDIPPTELGAIVVKEALQRADVQPGQVQHVVFGNVIHTEPKDMYLGRVAALGGGVPHEVPALTLNRLCGSGLQAVISAAQSIMLGDAEIAVAGGAESMSRGPHATRMIRSGVKMGDLQFVDMMTGALTDPFGAGHMGITAENVARQWQIGRAEQDAFAAESQRRAGQAIAEGRFKSQIVPIEVKRGRETASFDTDEHPKPTTTVEALAALRPAFSKEGSVTAGNASGINDGAAALVLMSAERAAREKVRPMAKIIGYAHAGVDPAVMGIGPVPAVQNLLRKTGLSIDDFDVIESNEAFAAQACAVSRELGLDPERTNPNGGAIALGHPVGATGAIILVKALYELQRIGGRRALCTMCIGGGQGIAVAVERYA